MLEAIRKLLGELEYSEIFIEEGQPSDDLGLNHDIYINNSDYSVYKKEKDKWEYQGQLGEANVNPDWSEEDDSKKSYILNKPDFVTPEMYNNLIEYVSENITSLETLIKNQGIIGFNYDQDNRILSVIRPDNTTEGGVEFPICNGLGPGFISPDAFLQIYNNEQNLTNEVNTRASSDVVDTSFDNSTNTLKLHRSDNSILEQVLPIGEVFIPVDSLESVNNPLEHKIYLVPNESEEDNNVFDEYLWVDGSWELIGSLSIDLANYYNKTETDDLLDEKTDKNHASTSTNHGVATTNEYGHIKYPTSVNTTGTHGPLPYKYIKENNVTIDLNDYNDPQILACYYPGLNSVNFPDNYTFSAAGGAFILEVMPLANNMGFQRLMRRGTNQIWIRTKQSQEIWTYWSKIEVTGAYGNLGTCGTSSNTVQKTSSNLGGFALAPGAQIFLRFTNDNTAANPTLNVNGTGAKPIQYNGKAIINGMILANKLAEFVYDGDVWELMNPDIATATSQANATTISNTNHGVPVYYPDS